MLAYVEAPEGRHDEASWALHVDGMLHFLYGTAPPPNTARSGTQDASVTR
jgi:hypothetical protein